MLLLMLKPDLVFKENFAHNCVSHVLALNLNTTINIRMYPVHTMHDRHTTDDNIVAHFASPNEPADYYNIGIE